MVALPFEALHITWVDEAPPQQQQQQGVKPCTPASRNADAVTIAPCHSLQRQIPSSASPYGGPQHSSVQHADTSRARFGTDSHYVRRSSNRCRYCALHGVVAAVSSAHRAACQYYHHCPCLKCRQMHKRNYRQAQYHRRQRETVAPRKAAAKQRAAGT